LPRKQKQPNHESNKTVVKRAPQEREDANRVVGRALVAIYNRQTDSEQSATTTKLNNGMGFSKPDARIGSIGARMFLSKGKLADWQMAIWTAEKNGYPRICKYAGQLNEVAKEKAPKENLTI
jgi:hypothetical protein